MKLTAIIIVALFYLLLGNVYANGTEKFAHYIIRYDTGDTYDVQLTDSTITWKGLEGSDTGQTETDSIKRQKLSNKVEVIHWNENSGTFVTLVFDRTHLRIVSSGKTLNNTWLAYGIAEEKNK